MLQPDQIERLNLLQNDQQLFDRSGQTISEKLEAAAINQEQSWIYPVRDGIISLIKDKAIAGKVLDTKIADPSPCLLYTSPSPRDRQKSRMPSSA